MLLSEPTRLLLDCRLCKSLADAFLQMERIERPEIKGDALRFRRLRKLEKAMANGSAVTREEITQVFERFVPAGGRTWEPSFGDIRGAGAWWWVKSVATTYLASPELSERWPLAEFALSLCAEEAAYLRELRRNHGTAWPRLAQIWRDRLLVPPHLYEALLQDLPVPGWSQSEIEAWKVKHARLFASVFIHQFLHLLALVAMDVYFPIPAHEREDPNNGCLPRLDEKGGYVGAVRMLLDRVVEFSGFSSDRSFAHACAPVPTDDEARKGIDKKESQRKKHQRRKSGENRIKAGDLATDVHKLTGLQLPEEFVIAAQLIDCIGEELVPIFGADWVVEQFQRYPLVRADLQLRFERFSRSQE